MPHVIIKAISGPSQEQLNEAAAQISEIINKTLGAATKYISVAVEEYARDEWEAVYNQDIKDKKLAVTPGYSNPKTFE